jgi:predicted DCC family thiol-disulfide oxidoreductase YuxK
MNQNISTKLKEKYVIFYDGDCGLCNYWVQWILKKDNKDKFLFASLQSNFGQGFLKERGLDLKQFNTIYLWKAESFYLVKSDAIKRICKILGGQYALLSYLAVSPKFINDKAYDLVAENRKKLAKNHCVIPTEKERAKFIS